MYIYVILFLIIGIILYTQYTFKESFQNAPTNTITTVPVDINTLSVAQTQAELNKVGPLIAANPQYKGGFNSDNGIDLSLVDLTKAKKDAAASTISTTAVDRRPVNDTGRQCDIAKAHLASLRKNIEQYKASNSWPQVRSTTSSIIDLEASIASLGC